MSDKNVNRTVRKLLLTAVCMFAFGYALVPLYRVYCDLTGRGTMPASPRLMPGWARLMPGAWLRWCSIPIPGIFPGRSRQERHKTKVRPGELSEAVFLVENRSGRTVTGRAIPSVSPAQAGVYISKMDCFCFDEQVLAPGESREMQVRFIVDTDLPERFSSLTLSYTFFDVGDKTAAAAQTGQKARS